jgi:predicted nucleic acid-binding protein
VLYLDSSALAKLFLLEAETPRVEALVQMHEPLLFASTVAYPEVLSTLLRAFRAQRISKPDHELAKRRFLRDWLRLHVVELSPAVLVPAAALIEHHGLRGFDAVHLCSALWLGQPDFLCFDQRLGAAARHEGLTVIP